jgi:transcription initiation factor TFIID TATA-box-binding protein
MPLNLVHISEILPNAIFTKQKFAAITLRLQDPLCTVLLFTSGKLVLTGSKTFLECVASCLRILDMLRTGIPGVSFQLTSSVIQNIVGNVNLQLTQSQYIDLDSLYQDNSVYCTYQKNMFPGLIFRPVNSPVVLLVFTSGKIVLTGAKSAATMHAGWQAMWPCIQRYVKTTTHKT